MEHARLISIINYDPDTGIFTNKIKRSNCSPAGKVLGTKNAYSIAALPKHKEFYVENSVYS